MGDNEMSSFHLEVGVEGSRTQVQSAKTLAFLGTFIRKNMEKEAKNAPGTVYGEKTFYHKTQAVGNDLGCL